MKSVLGLLSVFLPWRARRIVLTRLMGYRIHPTARIGLSIVAPESMLTMGPGSRIGHLNCVRSLDSLHMGKGSLIGTLNWITANLAGFSEPDLDPRIRDRRSVLKLGDYASISTRHYLDCSDLIELGDFSDLAGLRSVLLTHHMDVQNGQQACQPIRIEANCFLSTNAVILGGASLPHHSILAAGAVLVDEQVDSYSMYAGCPARKKKDYEDDVGWFKRSPEAILKSRHRWSARPRLGSKRGEIR